MSTPTRSRRPQRPSWAPPAAMPMPSSDRAPNRAAARRRAGDRRPPPAVEPVADAATEPLCADGIDPDTGLPDGAAFHRLVVQEDGRLRRYHRPATVVIFELDGLDRLAEHLGDRAADRVVAADGRLDPPPRPRRRPRRAPRARPVRGAPARDRRDRRRSTTSSASGAPPSCGSSRARSRVRLAIGWAGTAGDPSLPDTQQVALERMYAELRRARASDAADGAAPSRPQRTAGSRPDGAPGGAGWRRRQSTPRRIPRPGVAPVWSPASTTSVPLTITCSMPVGNRRGSS